MRRRMPAYTLPTAPPRVFSNVPAHVPPRPTGPSRGFPSWQPAPFPATHHGSTPDHPTKAAYFPLTGLNCVTHGRGGAERMVETLVVLELYHSPPPRLQPSDPRASFRISHQPPSLSLEQRSDHREASARPHKQGSHPSIQFKEKRQVLICLNTQKGTRKGGIHRLNK